MEESDLKYLYDVRYLLPFTFLILAVQLSFIPKKYSEQLTRDGLSAIPKNLLENLLSELKAEDQKLLVKEINYGKGHDWIWILLIFQGLANSIALGDKMDKGIQGWINLGKKLKQFIKKVEKIKLDNEAQTLLCISEISKNVNIISFEKISETEIEITNNSSMFPDRKRTDFISKEESYHIFIFRVNNCDIYIFGCSIDGKIELFKHLVHKENS